MKHEIKRRSLSIGEIFSFAWELFREHFKTIACIVLCVYIPLNIILEIIPVEQLVSDVENPFESFKIYVRINQILEGLLGIIATMAIAYVIDGALNNKIQTYQESLIMAVKKWPLAFGTNALMGICIFGLTLLLIVPGVMFSIFWIFTLYVVTLKNKSAMEALKYSKGIVQGRWWKTVGYSIVFGIVSLIIILGIGIAEGFVLPDQIAYNFLGNLVIDIVMSYFTVVWILFFINFDATKLEDNKSTGK